MYSIQFGQDTIPYTIKWSERRKTVSISVDANGVMITAPAQTTAEKIEELVYQKATWIRAQLFHFNEMIDESHIRSFLSGEKLPYLGRQYRLKVFKNDDVREATFKFQQGTFIALLPVQITEEQHREVLLPLYEQWIKEKGEAFVQNRIHRFTIKLQQEPTAVKIKDQQQRWGSCTANGQVLINWRILLAPVSIIDYVLAHELAHLKYMDHSKAFWDTLGMLVDDYEERKEWLRINGQLLFI
ncbi:SprT family zinc-dependent metalloprotease [Lysinibacillus sp. FSL K6-0232]|uniref:M48 family metallopeptidase n=1 Tax=Lysinibacillus sp. FSL K6-0232 TaxID=2921425 RepID=UPI0030FB5A1B